MKRTADTPLRGQTRGSICVWQSLFKVHNQTLRKVGDNHFRAEHAKVKARQRAGTLERVGKMRRGSLQCSVGLLSVA